jgi:hypothetical protein
MAMRVDADSSMWLQADQPRQLKMTSPATGAPVRPPDAADGEELLASCEWLLPRLNWRHVNEESNGSSSVQFQLAAADRDTSRRNDSKKRSASAIKLKGHVELVTKYLFIDALLAKMIASAQTSYQLSLQLESLRKRLKPKRAKGLTRDQISELHRQQDEKRLLLRDNQELFNKSRLTLQWFYTDYNLCYWLHLLHDVEVATRQQRERTHWI